MNKSKIIFGYKASEYQKKIFDFVEHGYGNAVIEARAGSAKSTTALASIGLIPEDKKVLFVAFNNNIVDDMKKRVENRYKNLDIMTAHGLGCRIVMRNNEGKTEIDESKYSKYLNSNICNLSDICGGDISNVEIDSYIRRILKLLDFSRFNMAQSSNEIIDVAEKYAINLLYDEVSVVLKLMEWGKNNVSVIDYTDMIWLPYELSLNPKGIKYDWIISDESQDYNALEFDLIKRCFKRGSRFIVIGDVMQSIYRFSGAENGCFEDFKNEPMTKVYTLPICYRCPQVVIDMVHDMVDDIQPYEGTIKGEFIPNASLSMVDDGDLVLCRTNAPLFDAYVKLMKMGKKCSVSGGIFFDDIIDELNSVPSKHINASLTQEGVISQLYEKIFLERNRIIKENHITVSEANRYPYISKMLDIISSIKSISTICGNTKKSVIKKLTEMAKKSDSGILLSTVHKAKGSEAENVYILCRSTMPSKMAKTEEDIEQETNLIYVAYTRAKKKLGFINENEVKPPTSSISADGNTIELTSVSDAVRSLTGIEILSNNDNVEMSRFRLKKKDEEEKNVFETNHIILGKSTETDDDLLQELLSI